MRLSRLVLRNLTYYWRTNLAVIAGVATAVAVLSGALLLGRSVRESLRSLIYERLGATGYVISSDRFFREDLAKAFTSGGDTGGARESCAIIRLRGVVIHEGTNTRAYNVDIYGVDENFWQFHGVPYQKLPEGRTALVGGMLARKLGVQSGEGLLLRLETQQGIPRESLYGRREEVGKTTRLICGEILGTEKLGEFSLHPSQGNVYSIFVPLKLLQRDLHQISSANAILLAPGSQGGDLLKIRKTLKERYSLQDVGVKLRSLPSLPGIEVESTRILLDDAAAKATFGAAADLGLNASGIFTYLANSIRIGGREIPYSVITAADLRKGAMSHVREIGNFSARRGLSDIVESIWLNEWAWRDLGGSSGDVVEVDYYLWEEDGRLVTHTARFRLSGVVSIGGDVDAGLAPDFPGITEAMSIRAWDPPFPLDLRRIRPQDEEYWDRFRATPKAFVTLARGQELWKSRFGKLSSVRVALPEGVDTRATQDKLYKRLHDRLDPELEGFAANAVRKDGLDASQGSTDFGEYFLYFSSFLIGAAILLSALFFRLGVEQRVREIGTLQAVGFPRSTLQRVFLLEGAIVSIGGSLLGLIGGLGYGALLVLGLRTWWIGAVGMQRLHLHIAGPDMIMGAGSGVFISLGIIQWTIRGLRRNSPRALLAGILESQSVRSRRARATGVIAALSFPGALLMLLGSSLGKIPEVEGFFGAGFLLLVSILSLVALFLRRMHPSPISGRGWRALARLGIRNAMHRPGRSLLCVALIASATFVIISVEAFRKDPRGVSTDPSSGTGGYPLVADSALPIAYDPNSSAGREALSIPETEVPELAQVKFVPFRERPGDDASCLNLYAPREPRILGAPRSFLSAGRFSFQESLASTADQKRNPWLLLETELQDGTIPAIGDANTIQYILHLSVGREFTVRGGDGAPVRLRLVGSLRDSMLQGELIISESSFLRVFPAVEGYRFFLLEVPPAEERFLAQSLMERLADWGFNVESSRERLAAYHRVENTYLSAFQSLGALGLLLGTAGLASVLLRNVLERRQELALLRAVGYRRQVLSFIIVTENVVLVICGLVSGMICALLAILPALHNRGGPFPLAMAGIVLAAVLLVGVTSSVLAVIAAFRSPLLDSLKAE